MTMKTGSVDAIMSADVIGRLIYQELPCSSASLLDRCRGHSDGMCTHLDPRYSHEPIWRYVEQCEVCKPERWVPKLSNTSSDSEHLTVSQGRLDWDAYFFALAEAVRTRATCRVGIGTVLVDRHHRVVSMGYNGAARGEPHCTDPGIGCWMYANHCVRCLHSEENAVDAAYEIITGTVMTDPLSFKKDGGFLAALDITPYVVGPREICSHCARVMAWAGIKRAPKVRDH